MTYKEKLIELNKESLFAQKHFLVVNQEIRSMAAKMEPFPEELLYQRDKLYHQYNKILKTHRRVINYANDKKLRPDSELKDKYNK